MAKEGYITRQARRLHAGEINRRRFIMSALGAGVTMPTAMSLASRAEARVPKQGGRLRYGTGFGSVTDSLDPGFAANQMTVAMAFARGNCLVEISRKGELIPELARCFEVSGDGRRWEFELRRGVTFHDGKPLTAEDVAATLRHHARGPSTAANLLDEVSGLRAEDAHRIVIDLAAPNFEFAWRLADHRLIVLPAEDGAVDPFGPNGTGGYVQTGFEPGRRATFRRNPDYWKAGAAHFDEVEIVALPDTGLRQNAVMTGDVDVIDDVDPRAAALLGRVPTLEILEVEGGQHYALPMRLDVAPFDNPDLRRALKHAIRRDDMVERVLLGHGSAGFDVPVRNVAGLSSCPFDPDQAAFYYRRSGHSGPVRLAVNRVAFPGAVEAAKLVAASAREAGILVEVSEGASEGWAAARGSERPSRDWMAAMTPGDGAAARNAGFDALVRAARGEADAGHRHALFGDAFALTQQHGGHIVALWANDIHAHNRRLAHEPAVGTDRCGDGGRIAERWWYS